jgi:hypothetical protein
VYDERAIRCFVQVQKEHPEILSAHDLFRHFDDHLVMAAESAMTREMLGKEAAGKTRGRCMLQKREFGHETYHLPCDYLVRWRIDLLAEMAATDESLSDIIVIKKVRTNEERFSMCDLGLLVSHIAPEKTYVIDWCYEYAIHTNYYNDDDLPMCARRLCGSQNGEAIMNRIKASFDGILRSDYYNRKLARFFGPLRTTISKSKP